MRRLLLAALAPLAALADEAAPAGISVEHPVIYETPSRAPVAGGYMTLRSEGAADRLVAVRVAPAIAGVAQIHEMTMQGEVMRMSQVEGGVPIPAGGAVAFERGGLHVMFMRLEAPLAAGDTVPATLVFETAGEIEVVFEVVERGAARGHAGH